MINKNKTTFFLIVLLITLIISISSVSATEVNDSQININNGTDVENLKISDYSSLNDDPVGNDNRQDGDCYIQFESNNITIKENGNKEIKGQLVGAGDLKQFEYKCTYTDANGIDRTYSQIATELDGSFNFDLGICEGLTVRDNPYILTFSPDINNDMNFYAYDLNFTNSTISVTVKSAYDIYVSPDGTDSEGFGSKDKPYKTINYAVSNSKDNDVIYIYEGNYAEKTIDLNTARNLTLIGQNRNVIIEGPSGKRLFNAATTVTNVHLIFINLTINNTDSGTASAIFDLKKNNGINELINCTIKNSKGIYGIQGAGKTIIESCEFINHEVSRPMGCLIGFASDGEHSINNAIINGVTKTTTGMSYVITAAKGNLNINNMTMTGVDGNLIGINAALNGNSKITLNNSKIYNNTFKTTVCGTLFNFAKTTELNVINSIITDNKCDLGVIRGPTPPSKITLNYNIIDNPESKFIYKVGESAINLDNLNISYNYWGTNTPKLVDSTGINITADKWIVLNIGQTNKVNDGDDVTIIANLKLNNGTDLENLLPEFPVIFQYNSETITKNINNNAVNATFKFDAENPIVLVNGEPYTIQSKSEYEEILYVGPNGTDSEGFGSKDKPYKTIKYAVEHANDNYLIYIYEGRYDENSIRLTNNLTIIGENKNVVITSSSANLKVFEAPMDSKIKLSFKNLTFDNINPGQFNGILHIRNIGTNEIINCTFENCGGQYLIWSSSDETIIKNCEFTNIQSPSYGIKAIYLTGHGNQSIINTTFDKFTNTYNSIGNVINIINSPNNITLDNISFTEINGKFDGISVGDTSKNDPNTLVIKNSKFTNNNIENRNTIGGRLFYGVSRANIEVINSIIADNILSSGIIGGSNNQTTLTLNYNLIYNNTGNVIYSGSKQKPVKNYNINYNYWGDNTPELTTNVGTLTISNWIVVETAHTPVELDEGDSVTVIAQLKLMDNEGNVSNLETPFMNMPITFEYDGITNKIINNKTEVTFTVKGDKSTAIITLINEKQYEQLIEVPEINVAVNDTWVNLNNRLLLLEPQETLQLKLTIKQSLKISHLLEN